MLNLKELEKKLDLALSQETEESLLDWLESLKRKEMLINMERYLFSKVSFNGFIQLLESLLKIEEQNFKVNKIKGLAQCSIPVGDHCVGKAVIERPPDIPVKSIIEKNKTPYNSGVFLCNIAPCQSHQRLLLLF